MNRVFAFALVASIGNASAAFAGESLLAAGSRHVQQMATGQSTAAAPTAASTTVGKPAVGVGQQVIPSFQEGQGGNLSKSSHSKATKALIYAALGVGFVLSAWEIDKHVLNLTPSSLGERKD